MANIQFHPTDTVLMQFTSGDLDPATSIMISTHLEFCPCCRQKVAAYEDEISQQLVAEESAVDMMEASGTATTEAPPLSPDLAAMMQQIMSQNTEPEPNHESPQPQTITLGDKTYPLPRALRRHQQEIGPWSRLPGNIKRAQVAVGGSSKMNFIFMDSDSSLPEHTHQGQEITLVLAGQFHDEHGTYRAGDFIVQTAEHRHVPKTEQGEDCLCLTLLDAPLHFTSGLATLLNPFSQLFFRG